MLRQNDNTIHTFTLWTCLAQPDSLSPPAFLSMQLSTNQRSQIYHLNLRRRGHLSGHGEGTFVDSPQPMRGKTLDSRLCSQTANEKEAPAVCSAQLYLQRN